MEYLIDQRFFSAVEGILVSPTYWRSFLVGAIGQQFIANLPIFFGTVFSYFSVIFFGILSTK